MKLTNKVTNAFFGIIAVICLFMPIFGYSTLLTAAEYNLADMFSFLKSIDPNADVNLLSNLGNYGFKEEAVAVAVFFLLMLLCLLVTLVLSFVNVPYLARLIVTGLGFGAYVTAAVLFTKICNAFVDGTIPASAITSLVNAGDDGNVLSAIISSFVSIQKMGLTSGAYAGIVCFAVLMLVNAVFFIFRKKFAVADGEVPKEKQAKRRAKKSK